MFHRGTNFLNIYRSVKLEKKVIYFQNKVVGQAFPFQKENNETAVYTTYNHKLLLAMLATNSCTLLPRDMSLLKTQDLYFDIVPPSGLFLKS